MITVFRWDEGHPNGEWLPADSMPTCPPDPKAGAVWWVDLSDPTPDEEKRVCEQFLPVHPLTLEDMTLPRRVPTGRPHLPKVEEFRDYLFVIANPRWAPDEGGAPVQRVPADPPRGSAAGVGKTRAVQLSAVITHTILITHHYQPLTSVEELRSFLSKHGHHAGRGPDYLFHLILDAMVDEYAPLLDRLTDALDEMEAEVFQKPSPHLVAHLLHLKRQVIGFRKTLILEREVLARLSRGEFELIDERETVYYRNVYDHLVRYTELIEGARETVSDLMQSHLASISNKLNEIMKVLAMISTTVLPMTLVAGIYGMNFQQDVVPDYQSSWGFHFSIGLMIACGVGSLFLFRWKKWL
jgi:magnesium transporter